MASSFIMFVAVISNSLYVASSMDGCCVHVLGSITGNIFISRFVAVRTIIANIISKTSCEAKRVLGFEVSCCRILIRPIKAPMPAYAVGTATIS